MYTLLRLVGLLVLGLVFKLGTAFAQVDAAPAPIEVTQTTGAPLATALPAAVSAAVSLPQVADLATQTMLWRHRGAVGFGVGIEHRGGVAGAGLALPPGSTDALLVGVSVATGEHTRLSLQTPAAGLADTPLAQRPMKVALTFQATDRLRQLRRGSLVRMELSGQTTLSLRARGGRLGLALTSRW